MTKWPEGYERGMLWIASEEFYDLCQIYRHAKDVEGTPTAAQAFELLKIKILDNFEP